MIDGMTVYEHTRQEQVLSGQATAYLIPSLQHSHFQPGFRQISSCCKAIGASADNDTVKFHFPHNSASFFL
ncbi:MAG: hypothetical protein A4E62_02189 [Syntrophorhabdus sp. PtaU1.Bin002]|nr:MAG: hypothetical protein A4E62_02189 [Syntrophorhabdus sp. PtaU1.Bin002]